MLILSYNPLAKGPSRPSDETDVAKFLLDATLHTSLDLSVVSYINY